jgi:hypothetical protein
MHRCNYIKNILENISRESFLRYDGFIHKENPNATMPYRLPVHRRFLKAEPEKRILFVRKRKSERKNKTPSVISSELEKKSIFNNKFTQEISRTTKTMRSSCSKETSKSEFTMICPRNSSSTTYPNAGKI